MCVCVGGGGGRPFLLEESLMRGNRSVQVTKVLRWDDLHMKVHVHVHDLNAAATRVVLSCGWRSVQLPLHCR